MAQANANLKQIKKSGREIAQNKKILIVDDEAYNCDVLTSIIDSLKLIGFPERVERCMNGK